jgi:ribosomal protein L40E
MPIIACPACGEDEALAGERREDRMLLSCERCGHRWDRDTTRRCRLCGSEDLEAVPTSTLEEAGRGDQRTPSGIRDAYLCWSCGARDATSTQPIAAGPDWRRRRRELRPSWRQD